MDDATEEVTTTGADTGAEPQEPQQTDEGNSVEAESSDQAQVEPEIAEVVKSERGQKRIQELANKAKLVDDVKQENLTLKQMMETREEPGAASPQQQIPPWMQQQPPIFEPGSEVTSEQLQQQLTMEADRIASIRIAQLEERLKVEKNIESDVSYLERTYPELNGTIQDKSLAQAINAAKRNYAIASKSDPNVRLKDFIEPLMYVRKGGEQAGRAMASTKLAEQATNTALKPSTESTHKLSSEEELIEMLATGKISAKEAASKFPQLLPRSDD